jgi:CheY-like chemotaxis protein
MALKRNLKVFVVDDEHGIAQTLATILNQMGLEATAFTNPLEVLKIAQNQSPDLLISDVMMPELSGIELAIQIKSHCPNCKILLFSGQAATADLLGAAREKGYHFELLAKPIHPADLLNAIRRNST